MPLVHIEGQDEPVEVDSASVEFQDDEDLPDGLTTVDRMKSEVDEKTKNARKAAKDEARRKLRQDEEFVRDAASSTLGLEFDEEGNPKAGEQVDMEKLRQRIREDEVEPIREEKESALETANSLKSRLLRGEIVEAATRHGVEDHLLEPTEEGKPPPVVQMFREEFSWNDEMGDFALTDGDGGFQYASNGNTYAGPDDFFARLKKSDAHRSLFKDERPGSSGLGETEESTGSNGKEVYSREAFQNGELSAEEMDKVAAGEASLS